MDLNKLIAPFGTLFRQKESDLDTIKRLEREVLNLKEIASLSKVPGWLNLEMKIADAIVRTEADMLRLSGDPERNNSRLIYLSAFREASLGLLGLVDAAVRSRPMLMEELERKLAVLREAAEFPEVSGARMKEYTDEELFRTSV